MVVVVVVAAAAAAVVVVVVVVVVAAAAAAATVVVAVAAKRTEVTMSRLMPAAGSASKRGNTRAPLLPFPRALIANIAPCLRPTPKHPDERTIQPRVMRA